jgi:large subunit ribosomal protein L7/L12
MSSLRHITSRCGRRAAHRLAASHRSNTSTMAPCFSTAPATENESSDEGEALSSPKLQELYDQIVKLPQEEVNILGALVIQVLGSKIFPGEFGGGGVVPTGGAAVAEEEVVEAKTTFDLKLVGFDAKSKIKVIKEVRAIAGLGLKEAKELVDSVPKVIQKDLKQDKADELKAQLEALGAQVEIV